MTDLSKNTTPLDELGLDKAIEIFKAWRIGRLRYRSGDHVRSEESLYRRTIYRIPAEPIEAPWEAIDKRFNFMAADEDGRVWLYEERPERGVRSWNSRSSHPRRVDTVFNFKRGTTHWSDSLIVRPGYVE